MTIVHRVLHFRFPDDTQLLTATIVRAGMRKKPYSDEPDLLIQAFGPAATRLDDD